ncbi:MULTISPECIES: hypothetical protein [unclassified Nostoc]|nr:hypothetical protein [Nostoc sp. JL23]
MYTVAPQRKRGGVGGGVLGTFARGLIQIYRVFAIARIFIKKP